MCFDNIGHFSSLWRGELLFETTNEVQWCSSFSASMGLEVALVIVCRAGLTLCLPCLSTRQTSTWQLFEAVKMMTSDNERGCSILATSRRQSLSNIPAAHWPFSEDCSKDAVAYRKRISIHVRFQLHFHQRREMRIIRYFNPSSIEPNRLNPALDVFDQCIQTLAADIERTPDGPGDVESLKKEDETPNEAQLSSSTHNAAEWRLVPYRATLWLRAQTAAEASEYHTLHTSCPREGRDEDTQKSSRPRRHITTLRYYLRLSEDRTVQTLALTNWHLTFVRDHVASRKFCRFFS
ncbi:hypothetical protein F5X68DRAFT_8803 [Plectosphaerella plurivora]|uniref:Uncharacterized protein n=1 Tax=Plectosphaerella plurivora TaxID=936078 RepID=A0A9P8VCN2_9PEZI|nr:hypothetical protein F5X68DRAFT_8803 [Plectosphaerella plurivora]